MIRLLNHILIAFAFATSSVAFAAPIQLSPQTVVDLALTKGARAKSAELLAQRSYLNLSKALGVYDFQFTLTSGFEYNQAQILSGANNLTDRTTTTTGQLAKKFSTGTTLTLDTIDTRQNSTLNPASTSTLRGTEADLDSVQVTIRQSLWQGAFGYADRLNETIARASIEAALETREEQLEGVLLDAMTLFWNAYIAEQQLKQNMAARDKYDQLVKSVRRKAGYNLSTPGELPRLEAEFGGAESRVKSSSADYLNALEVLRTAIRLEDQGDIELVIPNELPPVPQLAPKSVEELRAVRVAKLNAENARRNLDSIKSQGAPRLDLVAKAKTTGVEPDSNRTIAEMASTTYPTYYIGFEFQTPLGSEAVRGVLADAEVQKMSADNDLIIQRDATRDQLENVSRSVAAQYSVAKIALDTVTSREKVVRELEGAYRQGRQPLVELIRSYNDLFAAQLDRARAVGQYHISLNQLAAARDELVTTVRR